MFTYVELFTAFAALSIAVYLYVTKYVFNHFKRLGIPDINPTFPFGDGFPIITASKTLSLIHKDFYDFLKASGARFGGFFVFSQPNLLILDPDVVKSILIKDFGKFSDRGVFINEKDDPLSAHMFNKEGEKWKEIRTKLSPTFTSGKMKGMFDLVVKCSEPMLKYVDGFVGRKEVDVKKMFSLYTIDAIGSCAFGLDCNSFGENDSFYQQGLRVFKPPLSVFFKSVFSTNFPSLARKLRIRIIEESVEKFYFSIFNDTLTYRKQNEFTRNDFMQLLMGLMDKGVITHKEAVSEAFLFLLAGFETSATTSTFVMLELAQHKAIQDRLREEIKDMFEKNDGQLTYEGIQGMKYLGQVVDETLRKYPPLGFLNRITVANYQIPGTKINVEKGTRIVIPAYALQWDPEYFPNPDKFDPERFNETNKKNIRSCTYLPFGDGPRNCIGMRFGLMQTKIGLVQLLRNHEFTLSAKTKTPTKFLAKQVLLEVEGGVWVDVNRIQK